MEKLIRWFLTIFVYAGREQEEYEWIKNRVNEKNCAMLKGSSLIAGTIMFCLFFVSFFMKSIEANRQLYLFSWMGTVFFILVIHYWLKEHLQFASVFCYLFMTLVYGFAILLGTVYQPDNPATSFCVLLFVGPLLFMDRPYRTTLFSIGAEVCFCILSYRMKAREIAQLDLLNSFSFLMISIAVNISVLQVKIRDLVHRVRVEKERDTDGLTHLLTKKVAENQIKHRLLSLESQGVLLVLDIDDFKGINDTYGHISGDMVLQIIGEALQNVFRKEDIIARFGGDEFVVFLSDIPKEKVIERIQYMENVLEETKTLVEHIDVHFSVGIAMYPKDGQNYEELFAHADEALYQVKRSGKHAFNFYHK